MGEQGAPPPGAVAGRRRLPPWLLVLAAAVLAHGTAVGGGWVWDDTYNVRDNPEIESLAEIPTYFGQAWGAGSPEGSHAREKNRGLYRPLVLVTFALDRALLGTHPAGPHAVNVLLHALAALALLAFARSLLPPTGALLLALVWAIHPLHTEAVALLTYRTTVLAGLLVISALWLQAAGRRRGVRVLGRAALLLLACLAKEDALPLAAILPLHDLLVRRERFRRVLLDALPLALTGVGYLLLRGAIVEPSPFDFFFGVEPAVEAATLARVSGLYTSLLVLPFPLTPFYDQTILLTSSWLRPETFSGLAALATLLTLAARHRRRPTLAFLALALLISLLPYSHLIPFTVGAAERFLYVPSVFALLLAARGLAALAAHPKVGPGLRRAGAALLVAWMVPAVAWSAVRHTQWWSQVRILEASTVYFPRAYNAWTALGDAYLEAKRPLDAIATYGHARRIAPAPLAPIAAYQEARARARTGDLAGARRILAEIREHHAEVLAANANLRALLDALERLIER